MSPPVPQYPQYPPADRPYSPPQQAYPAQGGYPAEGGYPAQQGYPGQTYPPQQYPPPGQAAAPPYPPHQQYPPQHQYPPQQQYPTQQQYPPQQQYPGQPYPGLQTAPAAQMPPCRFCGCVPTADVTFRGHQGMIVVMRFLSLKGPFCRDCGLATFRDMTAKTLVQGWYGYASFVITPFTVLLNLLRREKVAALAPPQPVGYGQSRRPMDPGQPLLSRPMAIVGLIIPFAVLLILILLFTL
jgi:hypothetical protein